MSTISISESSKISLATPTKGQRYLAFAVAAVVLIGTAITIPYGPVPLPPVASFIPVTESMLVVCDLVIAVLLVSHAMIMGSRGVLVLAGGFFFEALIIIPHALTFPDAFAPLGVLGAGLQTTAWLFIFWHLALPASVIGYACISQEPRLLTAATLYWNAILIVGFVVLLTWVTVAYGDTLPALFADRVLFAPLTTYVTGFDLLISVVALLALFFHRKKTTFDLWLTVAMVALVSELVITAFVMTGRFCLSFYASRFLSLAASIIVLAAILLETIRQDIRIGRINLALQLERNRKLIALDAALGAMAHEIRQPLTSIVSNAEAAELMLVHPEPNLEEIREIVAEVIEGSYRVEDVVKNIRNLFRDDRREMRQVDINLVVMTVLRSLQSDLANHHIESLIELESGLPSILGHEVQLQETVLNLVQNALDAMKRGPSEGRSLCVRTERRGLNAIGISVCDSGPGIAIEMAASIFDAFVTTKKDGMGMGLAISRMIVERHGGELSVSDDVDSGARFDIVLPLGPTADQGQQSFELSSAYSIAR